jgi:hypothetical protein
MKQGEARIGSTPAALAKERHSLHTPDCRCPKLLGFSKARVLRAMKEVLS